MQLIKQKHINKFSKTQIGGKAYYLNKLREASFHTPKFIVIPTQSVNELILPIRSEIEKIIKNNEELPKISKNISKKFLELEFSKEIENYIHSYCEKTFGNDYKLAIRSSAVDEDSDKASFAGQHKSFMYVEKEDLTERIKDSIASAWSLNALSYRHKQQISKQNIQFAIIIQEMMHAKKSGVGFSMNVQGNMADMVLIAGYGAGEGVVSDQIQTDSYYINRLNNQISKNVAVKKLQLTYVKKKGLQLNKLEKELQQKSVLKEVEIRQLANALRKTEQILGTVADIEFSFTKDGKMSLLQMRPVTGIDLKKIRILDNTNIVESYPGVSLPLTFSFVKNAYYQVFKNATKAFLISNKLKEQLEINFKDLVGNYQGSIYYRLDNWYQIMSQIYPSKKSMKSWENAVGLKQDLIDENHFSFGNKLRIYFSIVWFFLTYKTRNYSFFL